ncbi:MAG TPA: CHAT domain-containing tetratricopeptide repeat protein [Drouetiella sp.]|jgi:CHAT domain-containing protein
MIVNKRFPIYRYLSLITAAAVLVGAVLPSNAQEAPTLWWQHTCTLADQDTENGNYVEAIKKLEPLVKKLSETDRDNIEIVYPLVNLANNYAWANRRDDAEKAGKRAIEIAEVKPPHTATLAKQGYTQAQILSGCRKIYRYALEGLANSYLNEERYSEAEKLLNQSIAKLGTGEDSVVSQALLGDLLLNQKREYKKAEESYKKVIALREKLKDPEELAKSYESLGSCYYFENDLSSAQAYFIKAIDAMQKANLATKPSNASFHDDLGNMYFYQKRFADAEKEYRIAVGILKNDADASDEKRASQLRDLGSALVKLNKLEEAEQCYNAAFKDSKFVISKDIFLDRLSSLQRKTCFATYNRFFKATDIHQCIIENQKKMDPQSIQYAKFLEDVCVSWQAFPTRNEAVIPLLKQAIAIRTKLDGPNSPQIAHDQYLIAFRLALLGGEYSGPALESYKTWKSLMKGGAAKLKSWQFAQVRLAHLLGANGSTRNEALEMADLAYDTESKVGVELYDLATLYELFGKFGKARVIYDQAFESASSQHNVANMATAALSRASLSFRERDLTSAWNEAKQAEALFQEAQGPEYYRISPFNLSCLQLLSDLSVERGDLSSAEAYARQLTGPLKWRPADYEVQRDYLELAKILLLENKNDEAKKIIDNAVVSLSNTSYGNYLGEIELAHAHDMLGSLALDANNLVDAELHFRRAYNLYRDDDNSTSGVLGMVNDLNHIARCYGPSDAAQSSQSVLLACVKLDKYLKSVFPQISFAQQCAFVTCIGDQIAPLLTYASNSESAPKTFQYLMQWQGLLVDSVRRSSGDATRDADISNRLKKIRNQLSKTSTQSADSSALTALTSEKEALERELALRRNSEDNTDEILKKTSKDFVSLLADDEAFIDIVHFRRVDNGAAAYTAFVVAKTCGIKVVNLPKAELIDDAVRKWIQSMATASGSVRDLKFDTSAAPSGSSESPSALSAVLSDKLWTPIKAVIPATTKKLWVCPDAKLATLPWSVLIENSHSPDLMLSQVDSPRALLSLKQGTLKMVHSNQNTQKVENTRNNQSAQNSQSSQNNVLLVGGIDFANKALFLPGTKQEVSEIQSLVKEQGYQLTELTGGAATKSALLDSLSKSTFAHIATHGFFNQTSADPLSVSAAGQKSLSRAIANVSVGESSGNTFLMERDPLLSSGLLVAPVLADGSAQNKQPSSSGDTVDSVTTSDADDHLTAEELVGQDLSNCRTVVLSACNSGRGKGYDGQGVMGLRAALIGAGAKGVLMSLWPVDDDATRELMKQFYLNLWSKTNPMPPVLALRTAQQSVRDNPNGQWKHPFYWAGWIYDGIGW